MNTAASYIVAVLHLSPDPTGYPVPVHLFALPAAAVDARASAHTSAVEAAAGLAFELATTDPDRLPPPWTELSRAYHASGLRRFQPGDVMVVLPPGSARTVLRYDPLGWRHLDPAGHGTGSGC